MLVLLRTPGIKCIETFFIIKIDSMPIFAYELMMYQKGSDTW